MTTEKKTPNEYLEQIILEAVEGLLENYGDDLDDIIEFIKDHFGD
jgi:hypothetical protein